MSPLHWKVIGLGLKPECCEGDLGLISLQNGLILLKPVCAQNNPKSPMKKDKMKQVIAFIYIYIYIFPLEPFGPTKYLAPTLSPVCNQPSGLQNSEMWDLEQGGLTS